MTICNNCGHVFSGQFCPDCIGVLDCPTCEHEMYLKKIENGIEIWVCSQCIEVLCRPQRMKKITSGVDIDIEHYENPNGWKGWYYPPVWHHYPQLQVWDPDYILGKHTFLHGCLSLMMH